MREIVRAARIAVLSLCACGPTVPDDPGGLDDAADDGSTSADATGSAGGLSATGADDGIPPSVTVATSASSTSASDDDSDDGDVTGPIDPSFATHDDSAGDDSTGDASCLAADPHEPNDTTRTATAVEPNPVESVLCVGDLDVWWVEIDNVPGYVEPSLVADPYGMGFYVEVYGPDGALVLEGALQTDTTQQDIYTTIDVAGVYTVHVRHFDLSAGPTPYAIQVDHGLG